MRETPSAEGKTAYSRRHSLSYNRHLNHEKPVIHLHCEDQMQFKYSAIALVLLSACDVAPPTPEEAKLQEQQQQQVQDDLYRQQLDLDCFSGDQKACESQQKLKEIDAVGDALEGVVEAANSGG
ncbi:hypothetical protein HW561_22525 [Rhodobacteraceae bacterium B1Z28]|uniref:Uncharacterized protein n=1 Tax=Ruegeria haliotis TaxID=2747601 RepID=A0ABX2PWJ6_9RHOB|nr:hypothetical protein [Ruegeria haliotis]NVO58560.1 hypothetical protein [Ruegeria haliotis]